LANVFLALGSNRGDSWGYLTEALKRINRLPGTEIVAFSPVYFTFPYGVTEQAEFLNMVVRVETILKPLELLDEVKNIEKETGRQQRARWHEREIDIDILLYDDLEFHHPRLNIPHAELLKRDFFHTSTFGHRIRHKRPCFRNFSQIPRNNKKETVY